MRIKIELLVVVPTLFQIHKADDIQFPDMV
jgi:hypothetical protein